MCNAECQRGITVIENEGLVAYEGLVDGCLEIDDVLLTPLTVGNLSPIDGVEHRGPWREVKRDVVVHNAARWVWHSLYGSGTLRAGVRNALVSNASSSTVIL